MKTTLAILFLLAGSTGWRNAHAQEARIGTFDRTAIVIAFYGSPQWAATLKQKRAEMDEARRANDTAKINALNAWGGQSQELAHQQLLGTAGIGNILDVLQPAFEEIEQSESLSNIVPISSKELKPGDVDVTDRLLDWLKASDATRKTIQDFEQQQE